MKGGNKNNVHLESVSQNFSALPAASAPRSTAPSKKERRVGFLILRESTLLSSSFFFFWRKWEVVVEAERNVGGRQRRTSPKGKKGSDGSTRRTREKEWTKLFFAAFHFEFSSVVCSNRRKLVSSCSVARLYSQTKASRPLPWLKMEAITAVERKKNQCFADEVFQLSFLSLLLASLSLT